MPSASASSYAFAIVALTAAPARVNAGPEASAAAAPHSPAATAQPLTAEAHQSAPVVVFVANLERDPFAASGALRILRAELADMPADVIGEAVNAGGSEPQRIALAEQLARRHRALAVVWLTPADARTLLLYVYDPASGETILRRVDAASDAANLDAAAVIVRAAAVSLLHARSLRALKAPPAADSAQGLPLASPPPAQPAPSTTSEAPAPASAPAPRPRLARLSIDYSGARYAPTLPWQHGLNLAATYLSPGGGYLGLGYLLTSQVEFGPYSLGGDDFVYGQARRRPISLITGYHHRWRRVGLEAEFAAAIDVTIARTPVLCLDDAGDRCEPSAALQRPDPVLIALGFAPRLRLLLFPHPTLAFFIGGGLDAYSDTAIYAACAAGSSAACKSGILLDPYNVRPGAGAGLIILLGAPEVTGARP